MGDSEQRTDVRTSGSPVRCPYCHDEVERTKERWVACEACLARHHAGCWSENGCCAGCGEARYVGPGLAAVEAEARVAPAPAREGAPVPTVDVELRGRRAHFEGDPRPLAIVVRADRAAEPFEVHVANGTRLPGRIELRRLPSHVRVVGPAAMEVEPGATARFCLEYDAAAPPGSAQRPRGPGQLWVARHSSATFVVSCEEDAHTVTVEARHAHSRAGLGVLALLLGTIGAHVGLIFALILALQASRGAGARGTDAQAILQRREADQAGRMASAIGGVLAVAALIATVAVVVAHAV